MTDGRIQNTDFRCTTGSTTGFPWSFLNSEFCILPSDILLSGEYSPPLRTQTVHGTRHSYVPDSVTFSRVYRCGDELTVTASNVTTDPDGTLATERCCVLLPLT